MKITIFRDIYELQTPYYIEILTVLERIKSGNSKKIVENIRKLDNKKDRDKQKMSLPSILFSGEFPDRKKGAVPLRHSGFIVLDIDGLSPDEMEVTKNQIISLPVTFSCFESPSGNGFKVLVKIPADTKRHQNYYLGLEKYFSDNANIALDQSGKNIGRVCYESYDPTIYINEDSEVFKSLIEDIPDSKPRTTTNVIIEHSENEIIEKVVKWWSNKYDFNSGRNSAIYQLAAAFNRYGVPLFTAQSYCGKYTDMSNPKDPFDSKEIEGVVNKVYNNLKHMHNTEVFENAKKSQNVMDIVMGNAIDQAVEQLQNMPDFEDFTPLEIEDKAAAIKDNASKKKPNLGRIFWYYDDNKIKVDIESLFSFINDNGYYTYYPNNQPDNYFFIKIDNNIIKRVDSRHIKMTVLNFVREQKQNTVFNLLNERQKYWNEKFLNALPSIKPHILRDSQQVAFIPTPSSVYKVTTKGVEKIDYVDLKEGYVWESQITKRDFKYIKGKAVDSDFAKFLLLLSGSAERAQRLFSVIGYLLHTYKNPANAKAVFLYDKNISQFEGEPEGGSGKSLIIEGLKRVREVASIPGDRVDFTRPFVFQEINESTQIACIDELEKGADISKFFSRFTGDLPIEKKRQGPIIIKNEDSPKFVFTSNYKPLGASGSHLRRRIDFGVSNYFSVDHTPMMEFKRPFFDGWDDKEWNLFFTVYIECLEIFINEGVIKHKDIEDEYITAIAETSQDFAEYWIKDKKLELAQNDGAFNGRWHYDALTLQKNIDRNKFSLKKYYFYMKKILSLYGIKYKKEGTGSDTIIKFT